MYFTDNALGDLDYNYERYCLRLLTEYKNGIKIYQEWSSGLCLTSLLETGLNRLLMSAHLVAVRCDSNFESRNFKHVKTKQKSTLEFKWTQTFNLGNFMPWNIEIIACGDMYYIFSRKYEAPSNK